MAFIVGAIEEDLPAYSVKIRIEELAYVYKLVIHVKYALSFHLAFEPMPQVIGANLTDVINLAGIVVTWVWTDLDLTPLHFINGLHKFFGNS